MELIERINDAIELETVGVYIPISDAKLTLSMAEENKRLKDAVKYMISVWDEVTGKTWREKPDHVQQKFLIAEEALKPNPNEQVIMSEDSGVKADNLVRYFKRFIKDKKY